MSTAPSGAHCPEGTIELGVSPSSPDGASYTCQLDAAAPTACAPGTSVDYSTPAGTPATHDLRYWLTDAYGNPGRAVEKRFAVDRSAPFVEVATYGTCSDLDRTCPTGYLCDPTGGICGGGVPFVCCQDWDRSNTGSISFHVTNDELPGATFRCSVDGATAVQCRDANGQPCAYPYRSCSHQYTVGCGSHTIRIVARDECAAMGGAARAVTFSFQTCVVE